AITSPTHKLDIAEKTATSAVIKATGSGTASELVLRYRVGGADWAVSAFVHRDAGHDAYLVATIATPPELTQASVAAKDVTLVLDRSGSMSGEPLKRAKLAAQAVVSRLADGDRVNVIAFDHEVDQLYATPQPLTDRARSDAQTYIARLGSSGGTNIAQALDKALAAQNRHRAGDERPHVILFLTDGQSDAQAALQVARADKGDARVFTIGVGDGVEKPLLSRLAAEKRGRFLFIESPSAIERKVSRLYAQIAAPVVVGMSVTAKGARLTRTYPRTTPDLFRGDELVVTSRIDSRSLGDGPVTLTLRGHMAGKPVAFTRAVTIPAQAVRPWVGHLWAQDRIDDLLEEIALFGETEELVDEVTNLAVAYNFATPYTSFLAIPESELTASARDALNTARARKQQILAAHKDAVALSRSAMPPGDPILKVRAPRDAVQVTAYFPFGLVKDLTYDADTEHWRVRFLVPKHVADGQYTVKIVIVHADGTIEVAHIPYTIDSAEPDFDVTVLPTDDGIKVVVDSAEPARLVSVAVVGDLASLVELEPLGDGHRFAATLPLDAGSHQLRVVVADTARNEAAKTLSIEVTE
ncbi:MAG: VWA domain-containing protein, partial [Myxococcota bacterium]